MLSHIDFLWSISTPWTGADAINNESRNACPPQVVTGHTRMLELDGRDGDVFGLPINSLFQHLDFGSELRKP
jgi:hypothetical protein